MLNRHLNIGNAVLFVILLLLFLKLLFCRNNTSEWWEVFNDILKLGVWLKSFLWENFVSLWHAMNMEDMLPEVPWKYVEKMSFQKLVCPLSNCHFPGNDFVATKPPCLTRHTIIGKPIIYLLLDSVVVVLLFYLYCCCQFYYSFYKHDIIDV